jgi:glutathione S-transferase
LLSPFVRRVAAQAALQGHVVERRDIMVQGPDFERLRTMNPVGRVPVLVLDDGTPLVESWAICDWLDETAPSARRLLPASGEARRETAQRLAIASGVAEKAVALVYERNRRPEEFHWMDWQQRLVAQIQGGLAVLEASVPASGWFGGEDMDISDVATVAARDFVEITNPWVLAGGYPNLAAFAQRANQMPVIGATRPEG